MHASRQRLEKTFSTLSRHGDDSTGPHAQVAKIKGLLKQSVTIALTTGAPVLEVFPLQVSRLLIQRQLYMTSSHIFKRSEETVPRSTELSGVESNHSVI